VYLDLERWEPPPGKSSLSRQPVRIRPLQNEDWEKLPRVFRAAAGQWPPLSQWNGPAPLRAARSIIEWARQGKDGPVVSKACQVASADDPVSASEQKMVVGAAIVTLVPVERLRGPPRTSSQYLPHLNWIFVAWMEQRRGIGGLLLRSVVSELRALGHSTLASTVLIGYPAPMLWHWSSGFRLTQPTETYL